MPGRMQHRQLHVPHRQPLPVPQLPTGRKTVHLMPQHQVVRMQQYGRIHGVQLGGQELQLVARRTHQIGPHE